ncbi:MAG TPA: hypothetical protein ENN84_06935 [Candidatus Marinimicrobia bacterium]|nr:hypothetical protein [Candidatus Neomarinimicrobiota bacterium]
MKTSTTALFPVDTLRGSIVLFSHPLNMMDLSQIIAYISGEAVPVKQIIYGNDSKIDGQLDIPLDSASKAVLKKAVCVN